MSNIVTDAMLCEIKEKFLSLMNFNLRVSIFLNLTNTYIEAAARKALPAFKVAFKIRQAGFKVQLCHLVVVSLGEAYFSSLGLVSSSVK